MITRKFNPLIAALWACLAVLLGGCTTAAIEKAAMSAAIMTPYQQEGLLSNTIVGGWSEERVDQDTYRISAVVSYLSPLQRAEDMAIMRAAEKGSELGYSFMRFEGDRVGYHCRYSKRRHGDGTIFTNRFNMPTAEATFHFAKSPAGSGKWIALEKAVAIVKPRLLNTALPFEEKEANKNQAYSKCFEARGQVVWEKPRGWW